MIGALQVAPLLTEREKRTCTGLKAKAIQATYKLFLNGLVGLVSAAMDSLSSFVLAMLTFDPLTNPPVAGLRSLIDTPPEPMPARLVQNSRPSALKAVSVSPAVLVVPVGLTNGKELLNELPSVVETFSPVCELTAILAGSFGLTEIIGSTGANPLRVPRATSVLFVGVT